MATQEDRKMMSWTDYFARAMQPQQLPQKPQYTQKSPTNDFGYSLGQAVGAALFGERTPKADNYDPSALTASMSNSEKPSYIDSQGNTIGADTVSRMLQNNQAEIKPTLSDSIKNALTNQNIQGYGNNLTPTSGAGTFKPIADLADSGNYNAMAGTSQNSLVPDNSALRQAMNNKFSDSKISSILDYLKQRRW